MNLPATSVLHRRITTGVSLAAVFAVTTLGAHFVAAQNANLERPPISWVNPKLPDGPGLKHHVLKSVSTGHDVGYVVWTPLDYDDSGRVRYPVIYFLHGMGGNESADAAGFSALLARGIRDEVMPKVLCVIPNGGRSGYRGEVESMIIKELIPSIDRDYPTKPETKARAVTGFSMGGAGAVRLSIMHPESFGAAGSWGGGMRRGSEDLLAAAKSGAEILRNNHYGVLLVNGDQDNPEAFAPLTKVLMGLHVDHEVVVIEDTPHNLGLYYQRAGDRMIRFLGKHLQP